MSSLKLNKFTTLQRCDTHIHLAFTSPQRVMSSAILNGGLVKAEHIVNLKVPIAVSTHEAPDKHLHNYATEQGWKGCVVGMMTAAPMKTLSIEHTTIDDVDITVLVTSGLNNARRAGDKADVDELLSLTKELGTINLILVCSAKLTEAAMVEALMIATESKCAALQEASVMSPISQKPATGTGTDAIVVVSGEGPTELAYCGKHVLLGELIGRLTMTAIKSSIAL